MSSSKLTPYAPGYYRKKKSEKNVIRFRTPFRNVIYTVLKCRGWLEAKPRDLDIASRGSLDCDIVWADKEWIRENFDHIHLEPNQKVNHFRNYFEVSVIVYLL